MNVSPRSVPKWDSVQLVRENVSAARSGTSLSAQEAHQLNQLAHFTSGYACLGCKHHCENVAQGVPIADTLRFLSYFESYDKKSRAKELYAPAAEAVRCADRDVLSQAASACPQNIDIAARLDQAERLLS